MQRVVHQRAAVAFAACILATPLTAQAPACERPPLRALGSANVLHSGTYRLTLVADTGVSERIAVTGVMSLWRTSVHDSSVARGRLAVGTDTAKTPFWGALQIDYRRVNAPIIPEAPPGEPAPDSRDPVYPGVLVFAGAMVAPVPTRAPTYTILVSTLNNRRDGSEGLDGAGIALWVRGTRDSVMYGDWDAWGIIGGGAGYFCLSDSS